MHHEKAHFVNKFFNFLLESIRNSERKVLQKCGVLGAHREAVNARTGERAVSRLAPELGIDSYG